MLTLTLSLDTNIYASGDVLAATQEVPGWAAANASAQNFLQSLVLIDADDQKAAMDLVFFASNVSLGTENAACSIGDTDALQCIGTVPIETTDYLDLGGVAVATVRNIGLSLLTSTLYVAARSRGTPTHSASGLTLKLSFLAV